MKNTGVLMGLTASEGQRSTMVQVKIEDLKPGMMTTGFCLIASVQKEQFIIKVTYVMQEGDICTLCYARSATLAGLLPYTVEYA